jgi:hypothetical protein
MNPSAAYSLAHVSTVAEAQDRHRGEERRHAHHRALLETRVERPSLPARLVAALTGVVRRDRQRLADVACRLPDGKVGRTAFVLQGGEWILVCRTA